MSPFLPEAKDCSCKWRPPTSRYLGGLCLLSRLPAFACSVFCLPKGQFSLAEGAGFEPARHFCPLVFKTSSIGRSDSPPQKILGHLAFDGAWQTCKRLGNAISHKVSDRFGRVNQYFFRRLTHANSPALLGCPMQHFDVVSSIPDGHNAV